MIVALDAMGGDFAPENNILGLKLALQEYPNLEKVAVVGQIDKMMPYIKECRLENHPKIELVQADEVIEMTDPSTAALRQKKKSSISICAKLLKKGEVDAIVSPGHTGAAVASTVVFNRTLPGIDRPAIATMFPSAKGFFVLLDVGANVDAKPVHLAQYAILGEIYAELILGIKNPSIGVLSNGEEDSKGCELTKEAHKLIKTLNLNNFVGNVESGDLYRGDVDVAVCDGFVGNIFLKTSESLAKTLTSVLKESMMKNVIRMAGGRLSKGAFRELKELTNNELYGGAPLLGINGACIIGHGSSSPIAVQNAIRVAKEMIEKGVNTRITEKLNKVEWPEIEN
ncbi:MAG: phosphate acyltransferase PlsX [Lentisphaeria bacterium]|nr:phosphate acyltransferase PlsX [Lentisphaeria bacterium]